MVGLMYCLTNLLLFDIPLLYYANLNSSMICCLFSEDIYFSFGISNSSSFCECNYLEDFFEALVILSIIFLSIKSPVDSAGFLIALFESFYYICCRFLSSIKKFLTIFIT